MTDDPRIAVYQLITEFAGKRPFTEKSMLGDDLGIDGSDSIEFLDKLENEFGVDLRPLIERGPLERTGLLHRLLGVQARRSGVDLSVEELIEYITINRKV